MYPVKYTRYNSLWMDCRVEFLLWNGTLLACWRAKHARRMQDGAADAFSFAHEYYISSGC